MRRRQGQGEMALTALSSAAHWQGGLHEARRLRRKALVKLPGSEGWKELRGQADDAEKASRAALARLAEIGWAAAQTGAG